ncbi:Uncharacterized protein HZ326_11862 [Fusarium oxysporum f. sp. albedinis]|nr:Uncharacterized protein HZ326_11862 [Fusarium oxysporum f. sp. albedinis]
MKSALRFLSRRTKPMSCQTRQCGSIEAQFGDSRCLRGPHSRILRLGRCGLGGLGASDYQTLYNKQRK